ncbi:6-carboxytetrahydropterin synthase QueD [Methanococcus aeolicus]|uniref:6-pyruvoyl tetrahydropterin synthase n=1 Tax=Methanococcus aeolicus (strain ATCC BAA-1280 / DSM 17508 / OCM 812 / Nankai-3) TaxID=419665 RepID=A6UUP4_META3|nr:6-carboxytetrahydropterin synthase QueD [Methanococcus aeolicus]ABR56216.1 6-pyruvoyl tetrahydropterin synthase [Methanococcus aeolicus Nankai-3]UXM84227.1 6-carboxytetrahydropterin synthase QueD [Methanococcus aeolicus]
MILELNGIYAGLRFASAHIVFGHSSCGVIHGHSYYVDVKLCGAPSGEFGFVCDFKTLKNIVKETYGELDHKLLVPINHPHLKYTTNEEDDSITFTFCKQNKTKEYKIPSEDVVLLPLTSTTAEELSIYFAERIKNRLKELNEDSAIEWIEIMVNEGIGQGAAYRLNF